MLKNLCILTLILIVLLTPLAWTNVGPVELVPWVKPSDLPTSIEDFPEEGRSWNHLVNIPDSLFGYGVLGETIALIQAEINLADLVSHLELDTELENFYTKVETDEVFLTKAEAESLDISTIASLTVTESLDVTGNSTFDGDVGVTGGLTVSGNIATFDPITGMRFTDIQTVGPNASDFSGPTQFNAPVTFNGILTLEEGLNLQGNSTSITDHRMTFGTDSSFVVPTATPTGTLPNGLLFADDGILRLRWDSDWVDVGTGIDLEGLELWHTHLYGFTNVRGVLNLGDAVDGWGTLNLFRTTEPLSNQGNFYYCPLSNRLRVHAGSSLEWQDVAYLGDVELENYYTKTEVDEDFYTKAETDAELENYYTKAETDGLIATLVSHETIALSGFPAAEDLTEGDSVLIVADLQAEEVSDYDNAYINTRFPNGGAKTQDGGILVTGGGPVSGRFIDFRGWDSGSQEYITIFNQIPESDQPKAILGAVDISSEGEFLVAGQLFTDDDEPTLWTYRLDPDTEEYTLLPTPDGATDQGLIETVRLSGDGNVLAVGHHFEPTSDDWLVTYLWSESEGKYVRTNAPDVLPDGKVLGISMSEDGSKMIVTADATPWYHTYRWDDDTERFVELPEIGSLSASTPIGGTSMSADGTRAVMQAFGVSIDGSPNNYSAVVITWDEDTEQYVASTTNQILPEEITTSVLYSSMADNGNLLAIAGENGVFIYEWQQGEARYREVFGLNEFSNERRGVAMSGLGLWTTTYGNYYHTYEVTPDTDSLRVEKVRPMNLMTPPINAVALGLSANSVAMGEIPVVVIYQSIGSLP